MNNMKKLLLTAIVSVMAVYASAQNQKWELIADGNSAGTYSLISKKIGGEQVFDKEVPDVVPDHSSDPHGVPSGHPSNNPFQHIQQTFDNDLNKNVFKFIIHAHVDDEPVKNYYDRQRNELKTTKPTAANAQPQETVEYRWKFKLPAGFVTTPKFTHIHQLKGIENANASNGKGDVDQPLITFCCNTQSNGVQVFRIPYSHTGTTTVKNIVNIPLADFIGEWVEVVERLKYSTNNTTPNGRYYLCIRRISDGKVLVDHDEDNLQLWRNECAGVRPKWGIYRDFGKTNGDKNNPDVGMDNTPLRDEEILFADFSIEKNPVQEQEQDWSGESVVTTEKVWVWDKTYTGSTTAGSVNNLNSLYVRGKTSPQVTGTGYSMGDYSVPATEGDNRNRMLKFSNTSSGISGITAATTAGGTSSNTNCVALNIGVPGRLYFYVRVDKEPDSSTHPYEVALYDNGDKKTISSGTTSTNNVNVNEYYDVSGPSTIFLACSRPYYILGMRFVPSSSDQYVGATTMWKFSEYYNWDDSQGENGTHSPVTLAGTNANINYDGLYLHTSSTSGANIQTGVHNITSPIGASGESLTPPFVRLQFAKTSGTVGTETAGADKNIDGVAFNAMGAGTVYVQARGQKYDGEKNRSLDLYFNGENVRSQLYNTTDIYTLTYHNEGQGTYYFKGNSGIWNVAAVYFVPDVEQPMSRTVTIGSTGWATFSASQNYDLPDGLKAYYVKSYSGGRAIVQEISDIPNNTGVLLEGTPGTEYTLTSKATATAVEGNMLVANIGSFALPKSVKRRVEVGTSKDFTNHILVAENGSAKYGRTSGIGTLGGNKSYLQIPTELLPANSQNAKIAFGLFEDITGIDNVNVNDNANDNAIYDLSGRKVADNCQLSIVNCQLTKGIYIINGKKIVVK